MHKLISLTVAAAAAGLVTLACEPNAAAEKIAGDHFVITTSAGACAVGKECTATIRLEATGAFHINDAYPYKFKAGDASGVEFLGKADKNVFSKAQGDFAKEAEKAGVMTVRFKPVAKGDVTIGGQFKMSVCSEANCQLEEKAVTIAVKVK